MIRETGVRGPIVLEKAEKTRLGTSVAMIKKVLLDNLQSVKGRVTALDTRNDSVAYTERDRTLDRFIHSFQELTRPESLN